MEGARGLRTREPAQPGWYPVPGHPGLLRWWDGARWTDDEYVVPGTEADANQRHPSRGRSAPSARPTAPPDRLGLVASSRHLDGSAVATLLPTLALIPVSLVALAAFWLPVRLLAPVPFWLFAAVYLAAGVLTFLRPVQQVLLRWLVGARRPTADELARLEPAWAEVAGQAGVARDRFVLAAVDSEQLNAFACGGHVVAVSSGALERLPEDELRGVLAHELGHHLGLHTAALSASHWLSLPIVTLARVGFVIQDMAEAFSDTMHERAPGLAFVGSLASALLQVLAWFFLLTVEVAGRIADVLGRNTEFAADRRAVAMGYGPHLALALRRVQRLDSGVSPGRRRGLTGHPSPVIRAARIDAMLRRTGR